MEKKERPSIGVANIIKLGGAVLIGKRKNSHGHGSWSFPGGHLEKYECFYDCAKRELEEETGLMSDLDVVYRSKTPFTFTEDFFYKENKHYITFFMIADQISSKLPVVMEPDKMENWIYLPLNKINNLDNWFLPVQNLIKNGYIFENLK